MNQLLKKPYKLFWGTIPIILVMSTFGINSSIDFHFHDTYIVISTIHISLLFAIILGIFGFIYWIHREKKLVKWMTVTHLLFTITFFISIVLTGLRFKNITESNSTEIKVVNKTILFAFLLVLVSQLIFFANILLGIIKSRSKSK